MVSLSPDGIIRTWNAAADQPVRLPGGRGDRPVRCGILAPDGRRRPRSTSSTPASEPAPPCTRDAVRRHKDGRLIESRSASRRCTTTTGNARRHLLDHQRHRRAQGARAPYRVPDARAVAPLQEPAGRGAGDRRPDGAQQPQHEEFQTRFSSACCHGPLPRTCWWRATGRARSWPIWCARSWRRSPRDVLAHRDERARASSSNPMPCTASRWPCTSWPPTPPNTARCRCPMAESPSAGSSRECADADGPALPHELARARRPAGERPPDRRASATSSSPRWSATRCAATWICAFEPDGLRWTLDAPAASVIKRA